MGGTTHIKMNIYVPYDHINKLPKKVAQSGHKTIGWILATASTDPRGIFRLALWQ